MIDPFGREITHLRISVTHRCNLECPYCHKEGEAEKDMPGHDHEMSLEKIRDIVTCAAEIGITKVKVTGGEPLLRADICDIVAAIASTEGIEEVSLVTNGVLLREFAEPLKRAELKRINIGCDSISSNVVSKHAQNILPGLLAAKEAGLQPIKLNMVVLRGINHHEIDDMMGFAGEHDVILQLIELIPNGDGSYHRSHYFCLDELAEELEKKADRVETRKMQARKQYHLDRAVIEIVNPIHGSFCKNCNKLRVTSDGKIKPCLMRDDNLVEFKDRSSFVEAVKRRTVFNY
jgi:cyclic pyranopterin phosphate synthase